MLDVNNWRRNNCVPLHPVVLRPLYVVIVDILETGVCGGRVSDS